MGGSSNLSAYAAAAGRALGGSDMLWAGAHMRKTTYNFGRSTVQLIPSAVEWPDGQVLRKTAHRPRAVSAGPTRTLRSSMSRQTAVSQANQCAEQAGCADSSRALKVQLKSVMAGQNYSRIGALLTTAGVMASEHRQYFKFFTFQRRQSAGLR